MCKQVAAWDDPGSPLHGLTWRPKGQPVALCKANQPFPCKAIHLPFDRPAIQQLTSQPYIPRKAGLTRPDKPARHSLQSWPYTASLAPSIRRREV